MNKFIPKTIEKLDKIVTLLEKKLKVIQEQKAIKISDINLSLSLSL